MTRKFRKTPKPDKSALPPLLNPEAESRRLASIQQRKDELRQERIRQREVRKTTEKIIQMAQERKKQEGTQIGFIEPLLEEETAQKNRITNPI